MSTPALRSVIERNRDTLALDFPFWVSPTVGRTILLPTLAAKVWAIIAIFTYFAAHSPTVERQWLIFVIPIVVAGTAAMYYIIRLFFAIDTLTFQLASRFFAPHILRQTLASDSFLLYLRDFSTDVDLIERPGLVQELKNRHAEYYSIALSSPRFYIDGWFWSVLYSLYFWLYRAPMELINRKLSGWTVEDLLCAELGRRISVLAVGLPGERVPHPGGNRIYITGSHWQGVVKDLINSASFIVVRVGTSSGLRWEIGEVNRSPARGKTAFLTIDRMGQPITAKNLPHMGVLPRKLDGLEASKVCYWLWRDSRDQPQTISRTDIGVAATSREDLKKSCAALLGKNSVLASISSTGRPQALSLRMEFSIWRWIAPFAIAALALILYSSKLVIATEALPLLGFEYLGAYLAFSALWAYCWLAIFRRSQRFD